MARKKYTLDEKVEIVLRGIKGDIGVRELCNEYGIQPTSFYEWKRIFIEHGKQGFEKGKDNKDTEKENLRTENSRLKELVADLTLENHILKKNDY